MRAFTYDATSCRNGEKKTTKYVYEMVDDHVCCAFHLLVDLSVDGSRFRHVSRFPGLLEQQNEERIG
jgi:hypothetical protein